MLKCIQMRHFAVEQNMYLHVWLSGSAVYLLLIMYHRQTSNINRTLVCNKLADHSDVVGALPVGAAPNISSFSTYLLASMDWTKNNCKTRRETFGFWDIFGTSSIWRYSLYVGDGDCRGVVVGCTTGYACDIFKFDRNVVLLSSRL